MVQLCGPTVKIFTAGDHFAAHFSGGENPGEANEFVELLLNRAGYTKEYCWECRIDKQKHCSGESRPIRVIGYKNYGVVLRVKPYLTAAVDYQMTLYIPQGSGYSSKNLFEQLKANEKSISRAIRQQEREEKDNHKEDTVNTTHLHPIPPAPAPIPPAPAVVKIHEPAPEEYRPEFKTLQAIIKNPDKLRYVLQKIQVVNNYDFCRNRIQFTETLRHECKWDKEGHAKVAIGRLLSELTKHEFLMETVNERDTLIGYTLTEKAIFFIKHNKEVKPPAPAPTVKKEEPKVNIPALLINMREKLQELADVANKIASNNAQKVELTQKIAHLDQENEELSKVLHQNREAYEVLTKLGQLIVPLPLQGMRGTDEFSALQK